MYRLQWGAVLFIIWLGLTNTIDPQELAAGLAVTVAIVLLAIPPRGGDRQARPWNPVGLLLYLPIFVKDLIFANLDIAARVLNPKLPINPGIVRIRTDLKAPHQRLLLANSITLTPGTVTLDMDGPDLYVHWIDVRTTDPGLAGEQIKGAMERAIGRI
jgi:multicomponent Na+:H+ antiporter subunit E